MKRLPPSSKITNNLARIGLVGNPNGGKTSLFNQLTGAKQRVGNWPGVTVSCKQGWLHKDGRQYEIVDLPGTYSLIAAPDSALDERIACEFIATNPLDLIINVVDATNLERHLYLTSQLLELNVPVIVVVNMVDLLTQQHKQLDFSKLTQALGCPVIPCSVKTGQGLRELVSAITRLTTFPIPKALVTFPNVIETALQQLALYWPAASRSVLIGLLERDPTALMLLAQQQFSEQDEAAINALLTIECSDAIELQLAQARYSSVHQIVNQCLTVQGTGSNKPSLTERIDRIVLNRWLGLPIFFGMMYVLFFIAISLGGALQDFFDLSSEAIFVDGVANLLTALHCPTLLTVILSDGVGRGVNTTLTFIPVIGTLFFLLAWLEDTGYMARAAFVIDRVMRLLGLPGRAFVPMIVGFGCNVPAVMSARTLEHQRDRILTILMTPFMSCSARLAIYAVFTTAFFPSGGHNIVFLLYVIGILVALGSGFIFRRALLAGDVSPLIMELPMYHLPHWRSLFLHAWHRLQGFIVRAGKIILPVCVLLGVLGSINLKGEVVTGADSQYSILAEVGKTVTPILAPLGVRAENWPATVGLLTGILAKEVVIASLNTLYQEQPSVAPASSGAPQLLPWQQLTTSLTAAVMSIPLNINHALQNLWSPLADKLAPAAVKDSLYSTMYQRFAGPLIAFAYLLLVLLYIPCLSTVAIIARELDWRWAMLATVWATTVAYALAAGFYQIATLPQHPQSSLKILAGVLFFLLLEIAGIYWLGKHDKLSVAGQGTSAGACQQHCSGCS